MSLLDRHVGFLAALRGAGVGVSLAEGLDAVDALLAVDLGDRDALRTAYAATVVKRHAERPVFDGLFDLWFPPALGAGLSARRTRAEAAARRGVRRAGRVVGGAGNASAAG